MSIIRGDLIDCHNNKTIDWTDAKKKMAHSLGLSLRQPIANQTLEFQSVIFNG